MQQWHEPQAGFRHQTRQFELAANTQLERLTAWGVDAQVFANGAIRHSLLAVRFTLASTAA